MTAQNAELRALTIEELETVTGGRLGDQYVAMHQWVHPLDIVSAKIPALEVEIQALGR